jgi:hypothetical protein
MSLDSLTLLATVLLAISLAAERLITTIKTMWPWLAEEKKTDAQEVDLTADRGRRLIVQVGAFAAAWATAGFLADRGTFDPLGSITLGAGVASKTFPVWLVGLLASGGSALWNNVLGYTKAAKDSQQVIKASETMKYHLAAEREGFTAVDGGQVARARERGAGAPSLISTLDKMTGLKQPEPELSQSRIR